jgi:3-deoxy-D-manno-octulosonate 8-phosphate phosphatase KdsC-like HAD superfamily phosphatase
MNQKRIIFDIDGVLADCKHRLHHILQGKKDWDTFDSLTHLDKPIYNMIKILWGMTCNPFIEIILLTGRNERVRQATQEWMAVNDVPFDKLYMRSLNDHRPAYQVKADLLVKRNIQPEEVLTIFEDEPKTIKHLREVGYHVCDVGGWEDHYVEVTEGGR